MAVLRHVVLVTGLVPTRALRELTSHRFKVKSEVKISKNAVIGFGAVVALGASFYIALQNMKSDEDAAMGRDQTKAYFTVDDGKTLFVDDVAKIPPFEAKGGQAVRAFVYTTDKGKTQWVQYLRKFDEQAKRDIEMLQKVNEGRPGNKRSSTGFTLGFVKRPGAAEWTREGTQASAEITQPAPPKGMPAGEVEQKLPPE